MRIRIRGRAPIVENMETHHRCTMRSSCLAKGRGEGSKLLLLLLQCRSACHLVNGVSIAQDDRIWVGFLSANCKSFR
jgi:hypothetical protein